MLPNWDTAKQSRFDINILFISSRLWLRAYESILRKSSPFYHVVIFNCCLWLLSFFMDVLQPPLSPKISSTGLSYTEFFLTLRDSKAMSLIEQRTLRLPPQQIKCSSMIDLSWETANIEYNTVWNSRVVKPYSTRSYALRCRKRLGQRGPIHLCEFSVKAMCGLMAPEFCWSAWHTTVQPGVYGCDLGSSPKRKLPSAPHTHVTVAQFEAYFFLWNEIRNSRFQKKKN